MQPVWEADGTPVSVGRKQRIVPDRTRRLVEDRDRGCVFPGCVATRFLEVHHLDHWADGGATDMDRLVCLCPHHHDAHHRGDFVVCGRPVGSAQLVFTDTHGRVIGPRAGPLSVPSAFRRPVTDAYRGPTGERLQSRWLDLPPNSPTLTLVADGDAAGDADTSELQPRRTKAHCEAVTSHVLGEREVVTVRVPHHQLAS